MNRHPLDATALIFGLLFTLSGFAIVSDEVWPDLDTTAVVGAIVGVLGLLFVAVLVTRQLREGAEAPIDDITSSSTATDGFSVTDDPATISD